MATRWDDMRVVRLVFVSVLVLAGGVASAKKSEVQTQVTHSVDDAMKAIKANKTQKNQVKAAMQEVASAGEAALGPKRGQLPEADALLRLFMQPTIDVAALDRIRAERDAKDAKMADALENAFVGVHAALDKPAREKLMEYEIKKSQGRALRGFQKKLAIVAINAYLDLLLDEAGCTDDEKTKAHAVRDKLLDAGFAAYGDPDQQYAEINTIFVPDALDKAALDRFRNEREDKLKAFTHAVEQSLIELHDALEPAHRVRLAEIIHERLNPRKVEKLGADAFQ